MESAENPFNFLYYIQVALIWFDNGKNVRVEQQISHTTIVAHVFIDNVLRERGLDKARTK